MATKVTVQNGSWQDAAGVAIVGTLVLQLSQDAVVSGTGQVAPKALSIVVTAGQAAATPVWGNDNLTPSGTVYVARLFDTSGALVWGPENWSITGAGPIEINTLVPASSSISYPIAIISLPSADQSITANNLLPALGNTTQALGSAIAQWLVNSAKINNANAGVFTNTQMNQYVTAPINSLNFQTEAQFQNSGNFMTEGVSAGIAVPLGATVWQCNAIAGYVTNASTSATVGAAVAVFGHARSTALNARVWGANFTTSATVGTASTNLYGIETDLNIVNAGDGGIGHLLTGGWLVQGTNVNGYYINKPNGGNFFWQTAFAAAIGATNTPTSTSAALLLNQVASGTNQNSQGITLVSSDPTSGTHSGSIYLLPAGNAFISSAVSVIGTTAFGSLYSLANTSTGLLPTLTSNGAGVTGEANITLGSGSGKAFGVIGVAKGSSDASGDRAYGGWFKASASNNTTTEVGVHAETNDFGGTAFECITGGATSFKVAGGQIFVGGGSAINNIYRVSGTLTFTAIAAQTSQEQTIAVTGASTTGSCASASPNATLGNANITWTAWVSSANTVSVRVTNPTTGSITPSAVTWTVSVVQ